MNLLSKLTRLNNLTIVHVYSLGTTVYEGHKDSTVPLPRRYKHILEDVTCVFTIEMSGPGRWAVATTQGPYCDVADNGVCNPIFDRPSALSVTAETNAINSPCCKPNGRSLKRPRLLHEHIIPSPSCFAPSTTWLSYQPYFPLGIQPPTLLDS